MTETLDRMPPQAVEVEASILGAMLIDNRCIGDVAAVLGHDGAAFYEARHGRIYDAALTVYSANTPPDQITVGAELSKRGELDLCGGVAYLAELAGGVASGANSRHHAKLIADAAHARGLIEAYSEGLQQAYKPGADPAAVHEVVDEMAFGLGERQNRGGLVSMEVTMTETAESIDAAHNKEGLTGIDTGLRDLNAIVSGWQNSDLIIQAARPGAGKTALGIANAVTAARSGVGVAFFSLEMPKRQLGQRMVAMAAQIDLQKIRQGVMTADEHRSAVSVYRELVALPLWIDDNAGTSVLEIRAKLRRLALKQPIGLVVVDYLQLMRSTDKNANSREQEVASCSRGLKAIAKEFDVPVLALAQLSRQPEQRADKRPVLSDLRESGSIEQDADVVMFIYRPEMYGITEDANGSTKGTAELIVGKQRNGPPGTAQVQYDAERVTFRDLAPAYLRQQ